MIHESMSLKYEPSSEPLHIHRVHAHLDHDVGARPVHLIITMIKWIRTGRLSIKNSLFAGMNLRSVHRRVRNPLRVYLFRVWGLGLVGRDPLMKRPSSQGVACVTPLISDPLFKGSYPMRLRRVVFPPPDGPRRITNSPFMIGNCV